MKMSFIGELIDKVREMRANKQQQEDELPDDVTRDRYLRSLRRQRRVQIEEIEKEQLKREIAEFNKERSRKYLWGMKHNILVKRQKARRQAMNRMRKQGYFARHNL